MSEQIVNIEADRRSEAAQLRDGLGFHPANTTRIQLAHEAARLLAALMGTHLVHLLPAGRDKALAKTALEDVMMRSNRAIALGKGPHPLVDDELLAEMVRDLKFVLRALGADLPEDPRVEAYKAEQRGEESPEEPGDASDLQPLAPFKYGASWKPARAGVTRQLEIGLTGTGGGEPEVQFEIANIDEEGDFDDVATLWVDDPEVLDEIASYVLTVASQLRSLKARRTV